MATEFDIPTTVDPFNYDKQQQQNQDWLTNYTNAIKSQPTYAQMYSQLSGQLGIPQLQELTQRYGETADDITSQLYALPDQIAGRSQESLLTQGQKGRMVSAESQPLQQNLAQIGALGEKAGARLSTAQSNLGTLMSLAEAQSQKELQPWDKSFDLMTTNQAREFSGYTVQMQQELDRLLANQRAGITLSEAEKDRALQLSLAEKQYAAALEQIKAQGEQARQTKKSPTDLATLYQSFFGG